MIELTQFGGMAPSIEPRVLADNLATDAFNTGFESGSLGESTTTAVPSAAFSSLSPLCQSILRPANSETRLQFSNSTSGVAFASLLSVADKWGRVYFTTATGPRYTVADNYVKNGMTLNPVSYRLGVKQPAYQVTVGTPLIAEQEGVVADSVWVAYVYTYVDQYGHEGPPSTPSTRVQLPTNLGFSTRLTFASESLSEFPISGAMRRIYRAAFDGSSSEWQFIGDVPIAMPIWDDTVPLGTEGEAMVSADWAPPPTGIQHMTPVASNFVAGFLDHYLCYSETLLPHAWPEAYRFPLKYRIVGLASTQNGLLVATTGKPYWCFGADPATAVPVELDANHPCLSARSIVDMGGYVVYASYDGLVAVSGNDVKVITTAFVDRKTWLSNFYPSNMVAFGHEGRYVFSVGSSWWSFDPTDGGGFVKLNLSAVSPTNLRQAYYDAYRDTTVLLGPNGQAFDIVSGAGGDFHWQSRIFSTTPCSFGAARILATRYPVTLEVIADGVGRTYTAADSRPFRLAAGRRVTEWQFKVSAASGTRITSVAVAVSPQEFVR